MVQILLLVSGLKMSAYDESFGLQGKAKKRF